MSWVIERDVFNTVQYNTMLAHLRERNIETHIVRIKPFVHILDGPTPIVTSPTVCYGSIGMAKVAQDNAGVFTGDFSTSCYKLLGRDFLNWDARIMKLSEVASVALATPAETRFFCKPNDDNKAFAGQMFSAGEFNHWLARMREINYLDDNDFDVAVCSQKDLAIEYRILVVGDTIIDMSIYRQWQLVMPERVWDTDVSAFVDDCMAKFNPADVYIIDVAQTRDGLKVVEYNTFNTAGWYALDVPTVIDAINGYVK